MHAKIFCSFALFTDSSGAVIKCLVIFPMLTVSYLQILSSSWVTTLACGSRGREPFWWERWSIGTEAGRWPCFHAQTENNDGEKRVWKGSKLSKHTSSDILPTTTPPSLKSQNNEPGGDQVFKYSLWGTFLIQNITHEYHYYNCYQNHDGAEFFSYCLFLIGQNSRSSISNCNEFSI